MRQSAPMSRSIKRADTRTHKHTSKCSSACSKPKGRKMELIKGWLHDPNAWEMIAKTYYINRSNPEDMRYVMVYQGRSIVYPMLDLETVALDIYEHCQSLLSEKAKWGKMVEVTLPTIDQKGYQ